MRSLGNSKDIEIPLTGGVLDGKFPAGSGIAADFRILLNCNPREEKGQSRIGGWKARRSALPSNEDLHDQLLGGSAQLIGSVSTPIANRKEVITLLQEFVSTYGTRYLLAGTRSRLYCATGMARNWRMIADGLCGDIDTVNESIWPNIRMECAQVGDYVLFTNGVNPVLAWQLGGSTIVTGLDPDPQWSVFEVYDLLGLGFKQVNHLIAWSGFVFAADVNILGEQYESRVYWSDFNRPLEWAPGGESASGYVDLGRGEKVLRLAPIGGQLRCYTNQAIYSVELVGGTQVFMFREIYRGDMAVAYPASFVSTGDTHFWMAKDTICVAAQYENTPRMFQWVDRASGMIFRGLDSRLLEDSPVPFTGFGPIDETRAYQIAVGWDGKRENVWLSWPTTTADENDFDGVKRMTLVINPRFNRASLLDHGFSAFAQAQAGLHETVRDFMVRVGACPTVALDVKEGASLATYTVASPLPVAIYYNDAAHPEDFEDATFDEPSSDSISALVTTRRMETECKPTSQDNDFLMVSTTDLCIKQFTPNTYSRETLTEEGTAATFPAVSVGTYAFEGYPTMIQGEIAPHGTHSEKIVSRMSVAYDFLPQQPSGTLNAQLGVSNSQHCADWHTSRQINLDCLRGAADSKKRPHRPAAFPFHRAGMFLTYRLFLGSLADNYSPIGSGANFAQVTIAATRKNETWVNS